MPEIAERSPSANRQQMLIDGICIACLVLMLLLSGFIRSGHNMFWGDEIMGWQVIHAPNWHVLLERWNAGLDSSGIWFYVLGRPWLRVFGATELSLRMFSATGIAASAAVIWIAARRYYAKLPVAASIIFVYAVLTPLRWQLSNARTYGIFMLAAALVVYLLLRGEDPDADHPRPWFLVSTFAAYCFLTGSHILGSLYAGLFFAIQLIMDVRSRRFRPLLYLSAICSLIVLLFSRANILATAALGKPSFWTPKPNLMQLFTMSTLFGHKIAAALAFLLLVTLLHLRFCKQRTSVYVLLLGFAAIDLLIFALSLFVTSIYVDRYLLPLAFGAIFALCELFTQLKDANVRWPLLRAAFPAMFLTAGVTILFVQRLRADMYPKPNYTGALLDALPPGLPIVDTDGGSFVELEFYRHDNAGHRIIFPLDWQVATDPQNTEGASGFHELDNFKKYGLYSDDILTTPDVLSHKGQFIVLAYPGLGIWLKRRILNDRRFTASKLTAFSDRFGLDAWTVQQ